MKVVLSIYLVLMAFASVALGQTPKASSSDMESVCVSKIDRFEQIYIGGDEVKGIVSDLPSDRIHCVVPEGERDFVACAANPIQRDGVLPTLIGFSVNGWPTRLTVVHGNDYPMILNAVFDASCAR